MQDDVLGIWGDPSVTGKPVGADIVRRKKTLPLLHGMEKSGELRSVLARGETSEGDVTRITRLLEEAGSRAYAEKLARHHYDLALSALEDADLTEGPARGLHQMAQRLLDRKR
jgi:geranylgeranyl diphosphate synthase type I